VVVECDVDTATERVVNLRRKLVLGNGVVVVIATVVDAETILQPQWLA